MRLKYFAILFFCSIQLNAQTRDELWTKINVTKSLNEKWLVGFDIQHRRQANYQIKEKNLFHYDLNNSIRSWVYYKIKNDWMFILSPIAYFTNNDVKNAEGELKFSHELRSNLGISKNIMIVKIINKNRFLYEIRDIQFDSPENTIQHRYRFQNNFIIPLLIFKEHSTINYSVFNEIFFRTQKGISRFDQNRIYNAFQLKEKIWAINLGYQYTYQNISSGNTNKNQLMFSININL
jgi:hypothetical protein